MAKLFQTPSISEPTPLPSFKEVLMGLEELDDSTSRDDLDLYISGAMAGVEGIESLTDIVTRLNDTETLDPLTIAATEAHIDYIMYTLGYTQDETANILGLESFNDQKEDVIAGLEEKKDTVFKRTLAVIKKFLAGMLKRIKKSAIGKFVAGKFRTVYAAIMSIKDDMVGVKIETELGFSTMLSLGKFCDDYVKVTKQIDKILDNFDYLKFTSTFEDTVEIDFSQQIYMTITLDRIVNDTDFSEKRECAVMPRVDYFTLLEIMGVKGEAKSNGDVTVVYEEHPVAEKIRKGIDKLAKIADREEIPQGHIAEFEHMCKIHKTFADYVELGPKTVLRSVTNIVKAIEAVKKERKTGKKK